MRGAKYYDAFGIGFNAILVAFGPTPKRVYLFGRQGFERLGLHTEILLEMLPSSVAVEERMLVVDVGVALDCHAGK